MKPKTELIAQTRLNQLRLISVSIKPSHDLGRFVVNVGSHGERSVCQIRLIGMTQDKKEMLHAGDTSPLNEHIQPDYTEEGRFEFINSHGEVDIFDDATNSLMGVIVKSFVELSPNPHPSN